MTSLAPTLQSFFTDRLISQRRASPNTIAGYRDTFRLLLAFTADRTGKRASDLDIDDIDAPLVAAFLQHLETDRHNTIRTRNNRLAPSTPCSAMPRCGTPNTPPRSNGSSRSRRNGSNGTWSPTSPTPRSTRSCNAATGPPGPGDGTTPCSC
jgi:hypothetical protein